MPLRSVKMASVWFCAAIAIAPVALSQDSARVAASADPAPWQSIVTGQIEAFRNADGAAALSFAGAGFRASNTSPNVFMNWIARAGYGPILDSERHSFGSFEVVEEGHVRQVVTIVGPDLHLYSATYQLIAEDGKWRVYGVNLVDENALAI